MIRQSNKPQSEMTAEPSKYPQGTFKDKPCKRCKTLFSPKGPSHMYCSEGCKSEADTDKYYINNYGVTLDEVISINDSQGGRCAICRTEGFKMQAGAKSGLVLDHCHDTGKVRGLLCHNCNRALGLLQDDKRNLLRAVSYLEGATTIPKGSTLQANGGGSARPGVDTTLW